MTTQDNNEPASSPKDGMQFYGKPITAEDVASFDELAQEVAAEAANASQSSTAGPAKGGNTSNDIDTPEFLDLLRGFDETRDSYDAILKHIDNFLAHVARQRQESAAVAEGSSLALPALPTAFATTRRIDGSLCNVYSPNQMHTYAATYGAQQREAGRLEEREKQAGLTRQPVLASPKA